MSRSLQSFHREARGMGDPQDRRGHDCRDRSVQLCTFERNAAPARRPTGIRSRMAPRLGRRWPNETVVTTNVVSLFRPNHVATRSFELNSEALPAALT